MKTRIDDKPEDQPILKVKKIDENNLFRRALLRTFAVKKDLNKKMESYKVDDDREDVVIKEFRK